MSESSTGGDMGPCLVAFCFRHFVFSVLRWLKDGACRSNGELHKLCTIDMSGPGNVTW